MFYKVAQKSLDTRFKWLLYHPV